MIYLKKFDEGKKSIEDWCIKLKLQNYTINDDNTVDVNKYSVYINDYKLKKIPIQFGIVEDFNCEYNNLLSLKGCPRKVGGDFTCESNNLKDLLYGPEIVEGVYFCRHNELISLEGGPKELGEYLICDFNPIWGVFGLFEDDNDDRNDYKRYVDSLDYNYLRGTNIIKHRFQEALEEIGKNAPKSIEGYKYI